MPLVVSSIKQETHDTKTFIFEDGDSGGRQFDYRAGQYLTFRYDDIAAKPPIRSYTMSSAPCDGDHIAVTVKRVEGGLVSNWMCDHLKIGSVLRARGPIGKFIYDPVEDQKHIVFIAAGSGVTPFVSIMKEIASRPAEPIKATLLVAYRTSHDIICASELTELAANPNLRVQMTFSRAQLAECPKGSWLGRISAQHLDTLCGKEFGGTTYMTCGPDEMMAMVTNHLRAQGVPESCIKLESFAS